MMKEDISDQEIRVIGDHAHRHRVRRWWILVAGIAGILMVVVFAYWVGRISPETEEIPISMSVSAVKPLAEWMVALDTVTSACTATTDVQIADIPLRVYVPLNARPHLELGYDILDRCTDYMLFFQAADVRADNGKIVGAFVLRGNPLSWGLSKRGYCAILDNAVTIGVADNSPLFEVATECGGYFFRQYPLVDNGTVVENEQTAKAIRRGLCELDGHIVVCESQKQVQMTEFAQALADLGATNAIYLTGSNSVGWCADGQGGGTRLGDWENRIYPNANFIVWSR